MAPKPSPPKPSRNEAKSDPAVSYNDFKEYEGHRYTGMKIGRSHKWQYDPGEWREKKITPDLWQIGYAVTKRRAGRAPEGSGVPVGTEYHWYVLAHQNTTKQSANDYTTSMTGLKFKIAHKRAGSEKWSSTPKTQRKRMITFLQSVIADLEKQVDSAGGAISAQEKPAAPERRKVRTSRSMMKPATRGRNRVSRVSPHHHAPAHAGAPRSAVEILKKQLALVLSALNANRTACAGCWNPVCRRTNPAPTSILTVRRCITRCSGSLGTVKVLVEGGADIRIADTAWNAKPLGGPSTTPRILSRIDARVTRTSASVSVACEVP